jgi:hypothetical protein
MKKNESSKPGKRQDDERNDDKEGYPLYPPNEDIYHKFKEEKDIDPEDLLEHKKPAPAPEPEEEEIKELGEEEIMGTDLDVPGADLDDDQEDIGNEDEENNYYSIGGDKHVDLEEDQGE